jgi:colanic acid/amylovoran biosynthesis glycosyltransferase
MKIGYVLFHFPALTESFVINEIIELIKRGHEIHVFSIKTSDDELVHKEYSEILGHATIHYMPNPEKFLNQIRYFISSVGFWGWSYPCENLTTKVLSIAAAKYFCTLAENLNLDVLHAHFNGVPAQTAMLMSEKLCVPFTFTAHATDIFVNPSKNALKKRMETALEIVTISNYNRKYLHELTGISEKKTKVVRACPIIDKFKCIKRTPQFPIILTVGRFVEKKGIKYGILSIKELVKFYPEIQYRIIGSGVLENELKNLTYSLGIRKNVIFLGNVSDESQIDELKNATVFILPCLKAKNGDQDGIPVSLMEAMFLQIPTISTKISGIPELLENQKDGFIVESKDVTQMVNAIKILLDKKDLRIKIGKNAKNKVTAEFNIHKEIIKMEQIWRREK